MKQTSQNDSGLSQTQHDAIRLLVSGCTAKYTALVLKLDYANVKQWIKQDAQFRSELAVQVEKQNAQPSDLTHQPRKNSPPIGKSRSVNLQTGKNRGRLPSG